MNVIINRMFSKSNPARMDSWIIWNGHKNQYHCILGNQDDMIMNQELDIVYIDWIEDKCLIIIVCWLKNSHPFGILCKWFYILVEEQESFYGYRYKKYIYILMLDASFELTEFKYKCVSQQPFFISAFLRYCALKARKTLFNDSIWIYVSSKHGWNHSTY